MAEYRGFDILDAITYLFQRRRFVSYLILGSFCLSYLLVYIVIDEQFEASALIIPAEDENASGISGMLKGLKGLPINLGSSASAKSEINRYNTIIFSRTTIEEMISRFGLYKVYDIDTTEKDHREQAIKQLRKDILTEETKEDAFLITVRSDDPVRAAEMANALVEKLNTKIIQLKVSKSRENRIFLEKRVEEISNELRNSEDSLKKYQEKSGLLDIKSQLPELMTVYSNLEADLMAKQLKKNVLERLYDKQSPEVKSLEIEISEYRKKLTGLQSDGEKGSLVIAMKSLPKTMLEYLRRYRQVEINSTVLEFILPLYEQAKIEEKKDYPILQVIDHAIPPSKKSWPPRLLFALAGTLFVSASFFTAMYFRTIIKSSTNPKLLALSQDIGNLLKR